MRIAIDGRTITPSRSGVGGYAERLVRSLLALDRQNHYILFLLQPVESFKAKNLTTVVVTGYERLVLNRYWENFVLPHYVRDLRIDLYFSPAYALPFLPRFGRFAALVPLSRYWKDVFNVDRSVRYVVTIHDVIAILFPQYFTPKMRMWVRFFVWNALTVADSVITDSNSTRNDLVSLSPHVKDRTTVIYPELDHAFRPVKNSRKLAAVRKQYSLPANFVLYVGTLEPRKNIPAIVQAYSQLPKRLKMTYKLVLAGGRGWYSEEIETTIKTLGLSDSVLLPGYIAHDDLPALYSLATVFVFPSIYEGFGYPPLEAMACGVPVICSRTSSLPEAVGDAAILVDPRSHMDLLDALKRVLQTPSLRQRLRKKGLRRARTFGWKKCAQETLALFESTLLGPFPRNAIGKTEETQ